MSARLNRHIEEMENAYTAALRRALDRLEEIEERRMQAFKKAMAKIREEEGLRSRPRLSRLDEYFVEVE